MLAGHAEIFAPPSLELLTFMLDSLRSAPLFLLLISRQVQSERVTVLLHKPVGYVSGQAEDGYEPASVLTPQAVDKLFVTLRQLANEGCSILYISHKLDEIRALCHHCTVLRGGKVTGEVDPTQETNASLSRLMIGAEPPQLQHIQAKLGATVLEVKGLSVPKEDPFGTTLTDIASRAGVSRMTVSNAFSRPEKLSADLLAEGLNLAGVARVTEVGRRPSRGRPSGAGCAPRAAA